MIVAFDLDDTLYPEETYVRSGFAAVAAALHRRFGLPESDAFTVMWDSLQTRGRGTQFDDVVQAFELRRRQPVADLVAIYRHHRPAISLPPESRRVLELLAPRALYVVTDGHKVVQQKKLDALGVGPHLRHSYLTHRYGIRHRKPSTRVFELMIRRERCTPAEVVYIGDDPSKDFCAIRPLGFRTVRVCTGRHAAVVVAPSRDAELSVPGIAAVPAAIEAMEREARLQPPRRGSSS